MDENRFSSEEDGDVCCLDNVSAIYGGNLSEVDTPVLIFSAGSNKVFSPRLGFVCAIA
jgi:hypothetical protein